MKKITFVTITILLTILMLAPTYAYDLPIDITAIGRQDVPANRLTNRVGANLFTEDAQRINAILAQHAQRHQETALTLFHTAIVAPEIDQHSRIMAGAYNMELFSQPLVLTTFSAPQEQSNMPTWLIVIILAICAAGGFLLALKSKKRRTKDVY